jgi:hypothetical protein
VIELLRTLDRLLDLERKHGDLIEAHAKKLQELADRITKLETREDVLISEAKSTASSAASAAVNQNLTNLALRVGALEERTRSGGTPLPPSIKNPSDE